jgi:peptidyl-prolyl cis-trans isomerase B (cyclophilin B)
MAIIISLFSMALMTACGGGNSGDQPEETTQTGSDGASDSQGDEQTDKEENMTDNQDSGFTPGDGPKVEITMEDGGVILIELDPKAAPLTVENFLKLVNEKFYDGLTFHRIIPGFMIQGGDPDGTGMGGSKEKVKGEFPNNGWENTISHVRGVISMSRSSAPDSASSQFFITNADANFLDGDYAAFGHVLEGMDEVDKISAVETGDQDRPVKPVTIKTIREVK